MNTGIERGIKRGIDNEEYDYLKMMKLTDINYNKIKRGNRKQLSHNSVRRFVFAPRGHVMVCFSNIRSSFVFFMQNQLYSSVTQTCTNWQGRCHTCKFHKLGSP